MTVAEIRQRFLTFFEKRGHKIIHSASLVPENDSSVLFTTAGMQPLVPYLLGEAHPSGSKRLVDIQKCVRTGDIDEVGDNTHLTFFEMMGNWSLGDYFKEEAIKWSYELLTSKEEGFGLDPKRLYITVFEGDENAPRDEESADIWQKAGVPKHRIYYLPASKNWWEAGPNGPCGPDTEMYYDLTEKGLGDLTHEQFLEADSKQQVVEIWNDVFMEYLKKDGKVVGKLPSRSVDTGSGLERVVTVIQKKKSIFETDAFIPIIDRIRQLAKVVLAYDQTEEHRAASTRAVRIIADHVRASVFLIADGVLPSNTDRGYVLRRLLRRAIKHAYWFWAKEKHALSLVAQTVIEHYASAYPELLTSESRIKETIDLEEQKFSQTLQSGSGELARVYLEALEHGGRISGSELFTIFASHGFPLESSLEEIDALNLAGENLGKRKVSYDKEKVLKEFHEELQKHQELSRAGVDKKFRGGLADTSEMSVKYHTATHLLHQALRDVLGDEVRQKGSNITPERLRFDFAFGRKMSDEEKKRVEDIVNEKIEAKLPMQKVILPFAEAEKTGALHFFGDLPDGKAGKYGNEVSVYFVGDSLETAYSKEFCGGPHVTNIGVLGRFKIAKEEAVSAGVRRIKAVLE